MNKKEPSWVKLADDLLDRVIELDGFNDTMNWLLSKGYTKEELVFLGYDEDMQRMIAETEGASDNGII